MKVSKKLDKSMIIKMISVSIIMLLVSYSAIFMLVKEVVEQESQKNMIQKARALTVQIEHVRHYISGMVADKLFDPGLLKEAQKYIKRKNAKSKEEIIKIARLTKYYKTIPIVSSWTIGQGRSPDSLHQFRVVRIGARNKKHEALPKEREMLEFMAENDLDEHWIIDTESNSLRYMSAVIMKKECLLCHGTVADYPPGNGFDPLGIKMEGWAEGEQRGAFEVISDLKPLQETVRKVQYDMIGIGVLMILMLILSVPIWFKMLQSKEP
jgi:methyl-accepting chemotaxis protein